MECLSLKLHILKIESISGNNVLFSYEVFSNKNNIFATYCNVTLLTYFCFQCKLNLNTVNLNTSECISKFERLGRAGCLYVWTNMYAILRAVFVFNWKITSIIVKPLKLEINLLLIWNQAKRKAPRKKKQKTFGNRITQTKLYINWRICIRWETEAQTDTPSERELWQN